MSEEVWTPPTEFHVIRIGPTVFHIDAGTRKELERIADQEEWDSNVTFDTIFGEEITLTHSALLIAPFWSSTPESRERERAWDRVMKEEVPVEERE